MELKQSIIHIAQSVIESTTLHSRSHVPKERLYSKLHTLPFPFVFAWYGTPTVMPSSW
jgi:hypothetical protein